MSTEQRYPLFRIENLPTYSIMMLVLFVTSLVISAPLTTVLSVAFNHAILIAAVSVMAGMAIMFVASVFNLRKIGPGFRRLADGEKDLQIPPVWCPVLTAATRAELELSEKRNV